MAGENLDLRRCSVGELDASYRIVFMPQGLGDILFFLMYATQYKRTIPENKIAVVVTKKHFMQLVELFSARIDALCYMDGGDEPLWRGRMTYFYDGIYNSGPQPYLLRAIQNAMGLPETARAYLPELPRPLNFDQIAQRFDLHKEKTVLIAPDAVSCSVPLSDAAWIHIADICAQEGYQALFNAEQEGRFGKYPTAFLPMVETLNLIAEGGNFIGLRSGLCDVMAAFTDVNGLIIYPNNKKPGEFPAILGYDVDPNEAYLRYCSLKNIFPSKRFSEVIYDGQDAVFQIVKEEVEKWQKY